MNQKFSIGQFQPDDWPTFKALRLESLLEEPAVFGGIYQEEVLRSENEWKIRLSDTGKAYFGLFTESNECIGLTGMAKHNDTQQVATLVASYIRKDYRGIGLSSLLYRIRLEWAKNNGVKKLIVSHRDGNFASKSANQHFGFSFTHSENAIWPDGKEALNLFYELNL